MDRAAAERYAESVSCFKTNSILYFLSEDDADVDQVGAAHIHTSAKLNTGVEQVRSSQHNNIVINKKIFILQHYFLKSGFPNGQ